MSTQSEALQLAEAFERSAMDHEPDGWPAFRQSTLSSAAAELRRLHAVNEELLEALKYIDKEFRKHGRQHWPEAVKARAAIAKAGGAA